jgi:hypothetical protein
MVSTVKKTKVPIKQGSLQHDPNRVAICPCGQYCEISSNVRVYYGRAREGHGRMVSLENWLEGKPKRYICVGQEAARLGRGCHTESEGDRTEWAPCPLSRAQNDA